VWSAGAHGTSIVQNHDLDDAVLPVGASGDYGGYGVVDFIGDSEDTAKNTAAWDHFWSAKISHPLRSTINPDSNDRGFHSISHRAVTIEQSFDQPFATGATVPNAAPYSRREQFFVKGNMKSCVSSRHRAVNPGFPNGTEVSTVPNSHAFPTSVDEEMYTPFPNYKGERYLMVWTSDYDSIDDGAPGLGEFGPWDGPPIGNMMFAPGPGAFIASQAALRVPDTRHGSFDIKIRTKFGYRMDN
jgi:hypothetical protein